MPSIADILGGNRRRPSQVLRQQLDEPEPDYDFAPNPLYGPDDPVERAKSFLRKRHVADDAADAGAAEFQRVTAENAARKAQRDRLPTLGEVAGSTWKLATGRHEVQGQFGEYLGSNARALRELHSNRGDIGKAQAFGFMEGVAEAVPRVVNPTTVAGLAIGGAPGVAAAVGRPGLVANEALQLSDAVVSAKESADAFGEGHTGMGLAGLASSTVAAIASALGLRGLVTPRAPGRPAPVRPTGPRPAGEAAPPPAPRQLPEHILEGELIHEAPPSSLPPRPQLPAAGRRPMDGGPIVTPPPAGSTPDPLDEWLEMLPDAGMPPRGVPRPQERSRVAQALTPGQPDALAMAASRGVGQPIPDELVNVAPPPVAQQRVRLSQPVDVFGERIRDVTVAGDQVLLHRQDGTQMPVPRAAAEQMGITLPPPGGQLRGRLEALQAQRAVPMTESAGTPAPDAVNLRQPPADGEPPPLTLDQDAQLAEMLATLRGTPDDLGDFDVLPPAFGGRGEAPPALADFEHLPAPPEADPIAELQRMFGGEPEAPALPAAREWKPPVNTGRDAGPVLEQIEDTPLGNNASGESGASMEAMSRLRDMKARGEQFVVLDRGGRERPLIGADAVDYQPARGETFAVRQADGSYRVLQENGGRVPPARTPESPAAQTEVAQMQDSLASAAGAEGLDEDAITYATRELGLAGQEMPTADLVKQAFTDPLTGLPNRQGLDHLTQRGGGNPLFAALDVRNLKAVNDILGMDRGDELIKLIGEELGRSMRRGEVPARFGGDEFMLALEGVGEEGRPIVQQKIMAAVDRALERFGTRQAGDFPLGARMAFGGDRDTALAEMTRQKGMEKGPKFRPMAGGPEAQPMPQAPANPVPGVRYEMPAAAIDVDAQRFQYRKNVGKRGVDPERQLEGKYDPARGGVIGVWRDPADGKTYVVNGHHRLELAQKHGADVGVVYLDAPDAAGARAMGAFINLSEGNSSMADAVRFMRDAGVGVDELRQFGIGPRSTIGKDAPAIASLSDPVRQAWEDGRIPDGLAATIGHAKLQPHDQVAVLGMLDRWAKTNSSGLTSIKPNVLKNIIDQVQRADTVNMAGQGAQSNIFDVLGEDQFTNSALHRAELVDWVREALAKDKRLFGFVAKGDRAGKIEGAGAGKIDVDKAGELAAGAKRVEAVFDQLERTRGPIGDVLNDASRRIMQGENANAVRQEALAAIRLGVETELRNPGAAAARAPEPGSAAPVPRSDGQPPKAEGVGADSGAGARRDLDEPQQRLPGEVGDVRDVDQPPALFDAPYALRGDAAPEVPPQQRSIVEQLDEMELPDDATAGIDDLADVLDDGAEIPRANTYDELPPNVRDFLEKRLKYTANDINEMSVAEATRVGKEQVFNPKLTERKADAAARYAEGVDAVNADFEANRPKQIGRVVERTRELRQQQRRPAEPPTGAAREAALQRQAPMREGAERELQTARETPLEEKRAATPREMKAKQDEMAHRARNIHRAMESGDYDEAARLISEQAEDWNNARLKAGTKEENKVPGKHRSGEYLASDFATIHQFLFTQEGRAKLATGGKELAKFAGALAKNPAVRGLAGGIAGVSLSDDNVEDQIQNALIGMVAAAGTPKGLAVLRDSIDHYGRTGRIMRKSPKVANQDIGFWRTFIAPSTIERTVPDLYNSARDVLKDLQEYRSSNPKLKPEQHSAAEKIARGEIVAAIQHYAQKAKAQNQPNLAKRLEMTANQMAGKPTAGQQFVKDTLKHLGAKKATGREFEHVAQRAIYRVTLGYALDSAAKNLFQPTLALLHVSPRNMIRALSAARTSQADALFNNLELQLRKPVETDDELGELLGVTEGGRASDSGRFMRATDNWNRKWVFFGSLAEQGELDSALAGKAPQKALDEAERVMRLTQGETGPMSSAPTFRGPVGGTMKPFMKYPNLAIENILDAFNGEAKYPKTAVMTMLGLGLVGSAFGLDLTDILIGGARPLGLDPFHPKRMQLPPAVNAARRVGDYISGDARVFGDFIPASLDVDDVAKSDLAYLVAGRYPTKVANTVNELSASDDPLSDLASLAGLTTTNKADRRTERNEAYEFMVNARQKQRSESKRVRGKFERALRSGDTSAIDELDDILTPRQQADVRRKIERGDIGSIRAQVPLKDREEFDRRFGAAMAREQREK